MYSKKVMQNFKKPKNYGKLKDADGIGKVGNITCGDVMWLYIKVKKNKKNQEIISDIKFETFGCVAAIATSSMITQLAKGKTIDKSLEINKQEIAKKLGGLPPVKMHCSVLASDALVEAVYDYYKKNKKAISRELENRHKEIEKDKHIVEERYSDWVKQEERMHKH